MNISVLDFIKFASRMPQIAQILVSTFKIFRGGMPLDPSGNCLFFFPWAIPGSVIYCCWHFYLCVCVCMCVCVCVCVCSANPCLCPLFLVLCQSLVFGRLLNAAEIFVILTEAKSAWIHGLNLCQTWNCECNVQHMHGLILAGMSGKGFVSTPVSSICIFTVV